MLAPHDPEAINRRSRLIPPVLFGGEYSHPFGTDGLGRDILSRIIYGSRISLVVGFTSVLLEAGVGVDFGPVLDRSLVDHRYDRRSRRRTPPQQPVGLSLSTPFFGGLYSGLLWLVRGRWPYSIFPIRWS